MPCLRGLCGNHLVAIFVCSLTMISYSIASVNAQSTKAELYGLQSNPYAVSYSTWIVKWTQWLTSITKDKNPAADANGGNCSVNQQGPVWFLAGTFGGSAVRTCTIPAGKAILTPILSAFCTFLTDNAKTETDLRQCAREGNNGASFQASVDGIGLPNLESYRVTSNLSSFTIPKDNPYGFPSGSTKTIVDGVFLFLKPLSPGNHILHFAGSTIDNPTVGTQSYTTEVTYNLKVQ